MKAVRICLALALCFCIVLPKSFASDMWEKAASEKYSEKVGSMFGRGLLNVATSPVDILVQTVDKSKEGPALIGTLSGMAGGLGCTAIRAASGIVDVGLFWVPGFNGFPVNKSYHDCLLCSDEPEAVKPFAAQPVQTFVSAPAPVAQPIVTVSDEAPATPKRKVRDPYRYVKK